MISYRTFGKHLGLQLFGAERALSNEEEAALRNALNLAELVLILHALKHESLPRGIMEDALAPHYLDTFGWTLPKKLAYEHVQLVLVKFSFDSYVD